MLPISRFAPLPDHARSVGGGLTAPKGFLAAGVASGVKKRGKLDLGLVLSEQPAVSAATFTSNAAAAAPVRLTRETSDCGHLRAIVVNAGNANACTGKQGLADAARMRLLTANHLRLPVEQVAVCSTGLIGVHLPMDRIEPGIAAAAAVLPVGGDAKAAEHFSAAIRTTDKHAKKGALEVVTPEGKVKLGFAAKGCGMISPNMATMLCFVTCDAQVDGAAWTGLLRGAVDRSFNRITVDGQESTNDTVLGLCNGASGDRARGRGAGAARPGARRRAARARPVDRRRRRGLDADDEAHGHWRAGRGARRRRWPAPSPTRRSSRRPSSAAIPTGAASCRPSARRSGATATTTCPARISYEDMVIVEKRPAGGAGRSPAGPARRDHAPARDRPDRGAQRPGCGGHRLLQRPHARLRHPERGVLDMTVRHQKTVKTLLEAMPYIRRFWGATVVLKYGGAAMTSPRLQEQFAEDVVLLRLVGMKPIVVHGGGPAISRHMKKLGMEPEFVDGHRVTDEATMEVAKMVLVGKVNKEIVGLISRHGGSAVGISGEDGRLLRVSPKKHTDAAGNDVDLGFVGEVEEVNTERPRPARRGQHPRRRQRRRRRVGEAYNVNADTVAGEIAAAMHAEKIIFLTDVDGIYEDQGGDVTPVSECDLAYLGALQAAGRIGGGMVPKVAAVRKALEGGVSSAHIIDGRVEHAVLLEIMTDAGCGTKVTA